jgi:hypothetical protein
MIHARDIPAPAATSLVSPRLIAFRESVKQLRLSTLAAGNPWMIWEEGMPDAAFYLEYPDGRITLNMLNSEDEHVYLKTLDTDEAAYVRQLAGIDRVIL